MVMVSGCVDSTVSKVKVKGVVQSIFGWIIAVSGGFMALASCAVAFEDGFGAVMALFFFCVTAIGVWLIILGNKKFKLIRRFYDYSARLASDPEKSIDSLASDAGVAAAAAAKNIRNMLAAGFFPGCYLDEQRNRLVIPVVSGKQASTAAAPASAATAQTEKYSMIQCKNCGATSRIASGAAGECEYCGSPLPLSSAAASCRENQSGGGDHAAKPIPQNSVHMEESSFIKTIPCVGNTIFEKKKFVIYRTYAEVRGRKNNAIELHIDFKNVAEYKKAFLYEGAIKFKMKNGQKYIVNLYRVKRYRLAMDALAGLIDA